MTDTIKQMLNWTIACMGTDQFVAARAELIEEIGRTFPE